MDVLVYRYKTLLMQRLTDWSARGYYAWTSGVIPADRALGLCEKFSTRYAVTRTRHQRRHAKDDGQANAVLLLADLDKQQRLHWWLLVTAGTHPAHSLEKLTDSRERDGRIVVTGYEMLQLQNDRRNGGSIRWTWRMTDSTYATWEANIRGAVRGKHPEEEHREVIASLCRSPGFHGIRTQVDRLLRLLASEWRRAGRGQLDLPARLTPWVRRIADENYLVTDWLRDRYPRVQQIDPSPQFALPIDDPAAVVIDQANGALSGVD